MAKGPSTPTTDPGMTSDDGELEITPTAVQLNMQVEPIWNDCLWRLVKPHFCSNRKIKLRRKFVDPIYVAAFFEMIMIFEDWQFNIKNAWEKLF